VAINESPFKVGTVAAVKLAREEARTRRLHQRKSIKTAWRLTCKGAKFDDLHFHDLRREAGSRWMDAGVPLATI